MTSEKYNTECEKRGGRKAVAEALGLSHDVIERRCNGAVSVKLEAERSLLMLPLHPAWQTLRRLKADAAFRERYQRATERLQPGEKRATRAALLAEARACLPGRKPTQPT